MRIKNIAIGNKRCRAVNIVIGPNGSGKSTFLRDAYDQAINSTSTLSSTTDKTKWPNIFISDFMHITVQECRDWTDNLEIIPNVNSNRKEVYSHIGDFRKKSQLDKTSLELFRTQISRANSIQDIDDPFLVNIRTARITWTSVDERFDFSNNPGGSREKRNSTANISFANHLHHNPLLLKKMNRHLETLFEKKIFLEPHNLPTIELLVGPSSLAGPSTKFKITQKSEAEHAYEKWKQSNLSSLATPEQEGHGVRAALGVLFALCNNETDILFLDEPELCLYPDTKRKLGKIIVEESKQKQIFVVTHDVDVLSGIVNSGSEFSLIRIDSERVVKAFDFNNNVLNHVGTSRKIDEALSALFHDQAVFVEGINDAYVYGGAISRSKLDGGKSTRLIACSGNDRVAHAMKLSLEVGIPTAVIVDFDTVFTPTKKGQATRLVEMIEVVKSYRSTPQDVSTLNRATQLVMQIVGAIPKQSPNKKLGLKAGFPASVDQDIKELIRLINPYGLFVIPEGGLESWFIVTGFPEDLLRRYNHFPRSRYRTLTEFLQGVCMMLERGKWTP